MNTKKFSQVFGVCALVGTFIVPAGAQAHQIDEPIPYNVGWYGGWYDVDHANTDTQVRWIQDVLKPLLDHGDITLPDTEDVPFEVDGVYGAKTEMVVRAFQDMMGIDADGVVGHDTWIMLLRVANRYTDNNWITTVGEGQ